MHTYIRSTGCPYAPDTCVTQGWTGLDLEPDATVRGRNGNRTQYTIIWDGGCIRIHPSTHSLPLEYILLGNVPPQHRYEMLTTKMGSGGASDEGEGMGWLSVPSVLRFALPAALAASSTGVG